MKGSHEWGKRQAGLSMDWWEPSGGDDWTYGVVLFAAGEGAAVGGGAATIIRFEGGGLDWRFGPAHLHGLLEAHYGDYILLLGPLVLIFF